MLYAVYRQDVCKKDGKNCFGKDPPSPTTRHKILYLEYAQFAPPPSPFVANCRIFLQLYGTQLHTYALGLMGHAVHTYTVQGGGGHKNMGSYVLRVAYCTVYILYYGSITNI